MSVRAITAVVEIHENPEIAFSDGQQTLYHEQASKLYEKLRITKELANSF